MVYPILTAGLGIILTLAGAYYGAHPVLFFIAVAFFLASVFLFYQERKNAQKEHEDICDKIDEARLFLEEHLQSVTEPPELTRLKEIAKKAGLPLEACLLKFEQSTLFDQGLKALLDRRYQDAEQFFTENTQASKQEPAETWFYLGNALYFQGKYAKASEKYQEALKQKPDHAKAWSNWGVSLEKLGKYDEAIEKYQEALKHKPNHAEVWYNWGNALAELGKNKEAIEKYQEALRHNPDSVEAKENLEKLLDLQQQNQ